MRPGPPEPKGKLDVMTGYSFTTPVWEGGRWVVPVVAGVTAARKVNGPEDQPRDVPCQWDKVEQTAAVADLAETVAGSLTDPDRRAQALAAVAEVLVWAGHNARAVAVARSITDRSGRAQVLVAVAEALAARGDAA